MERKIWVNRHNPIHTDVAPKAPLTVGNGSFAFTADITGLQTLAPAYAAETPLCTMAEWGWHSVPAPTPTGRYTLADVQMERFSFCGREVRYASTCYPGNERVYHWLRENPHKTHLARVGLRLNGQDLAPEDFSDIRQELRLYSGQLLSRYRLRGRPCLAETWCSPHTDTIAVEIESGLLREGLTLDLDFPYGAPDITGADWDAGDKHTTVLTGNVIRRHVDDLVYSVRVDAEDADIEQPAPHRVRIIPRGETLRVALTFAPDGCPAQASVRQVEGSSVSWWRDFWEKGGMLDLSGSVDPRAKELERRVVLSLYLLAVNSSGHMPPAETGLTCNSWYGKAHLEMHFWHIAWAPLWGHADLLERSLQWYIARLPAARENAARNGYRGARWPKMVASDGQDSPSPIAVLLVWQQPHILTLLDLLKRARQKERPDQVPALLAKYWPLVRETADFIADYAVPDAEGVCHIQPPVIPVQERYDPRETVDPAFEVAYWKFGLDIAIRWARELGEAPDARWLDVYARMAPPPTHEGLYIAHAGAPNTFPEHMDDHPSMLQCLGMLPGDGIDRRAMVRTLLTVMRRWDLSSLWGWDFAVMAMTALRLGDPETAMACLMQETQKNTYVESGNNRQDGRSDLPLYLPGNGSLLLAAAMMAAGWDGSPEAPGFSPLKGWQARWEGILPWYG